MSRVGKGWPNNSRSLPSDDLHAHSPCRHAPGCDGGADRGAAVPGREPGQCAHGRSAGAARGRCDDSPCRGGWAAGRDRRPQSLGSGPGRAWLGELGLARRHAGARCRRQRQAGLAAVGQRRPGRAGGADGAGQRCARHPRIARTARIANTPDRSPRRAAGRLALRGRHRGAQRTQAVADQAGRCATPMAGTRRLARCRRPHVDGGPDRGRLHHARA